MIIESKRVLLFIHPKHGRSRKPTNDSLTQTIEKLLEIAKHTAGKSGVVNESGQFSRGIGCMGVHTCCCGAESDSCDYEIAPGIYTNALASHYLRWHREEVPEQELVKIRGLVPRTDSLFADFD
jgi:hypothetical protein